MTMPHLMNCSHSGDGWCLQCVGELQSEVDKMKELSEIASQIVTDVEDEANYDANFDHVRLRHTLYEKMKDLTSK